MLTFLCILLLNACSSMDVKPWDKDVLSRQDMQFGAKDLNNAFSDHFYFSKEGSSGGRGFAGGGCGCN